VLADAVERGKAYLEAGAPTVFVPGPLNEEHISTLVDAFGPQRLTVIGFPGSTPLDRLAELGVARISYGPQPMRVALTALQELAESIYAGGGIPTSTRQNLT
jgi:2-methylisocitrate lyase-like PEP mutase family enzyme